MISRDRSAIDVELEIRKIYTRNPKGKKWFGKREALFTNRPEEVLDHPGVDIVIEALGFQSATHLPQFRDYILRAFRNGKSVVTSDKAVLARYGKEIWAAAKSSGQQLRFEACVGGGIPVIRSLSESFAVEQPEAIFGIVNGTCNYILSQMEKSGKPYAEALRGSAAKRLRGNQSCLRRQRQRRRSQAAPAQHGRLRFADRTGQDLAQGHRRYPSGRFSLCPTHRRQYHQTIGGGAPARFGGASLCLAGVGPGR